MSVERGGGAGATSRLPGTKSVLPDITDLSESDQIRMLRDVLLTTDDGTDIEVMRKTLKFVCDYPERAKLPVHTDGEVRSRYVEFVEKVWDAEDYVEGRMESSEVSEYQAERAMCWADAFCLTLQRYKSAKQTELHFGNSDTGESFTLEASNRWKAEYQEEQLAKMQGWCRQAAGGDYDGVDNVPDGVEVDGLYDDPMMVLLTRSASSEPDVRLTPGEHEANLADSWSTVYSAIRNVMRDLGIDDWSYDARSEPHPGSGHAINACYGHEHVVLIVDADVSKGRLREELRRVQGAHVRAIPTAGRDAHDLDLSSEEWADMSVDVDSCQVIDLDDEDEDVENPAGYVGAYASIDSDSGLMDRSVEYVAWASVKDALNTQTMRRSEWAVEMAQADLDLIQSYSDEAHTSEASDESVWYDDGSGEADDPESPSEASVGDSGYPYSDWGGKAASTGGAVVGEVLADEIRDVASDDQSVSDVVEQLRDSGWGLSEEVVEAARCRDRVERAAAEVGEESIPRIAGRLSGDVRPDTVEWVLSGCDVSSRLERYIRSEFDESDDPVDVVDELVGRSMRVSEDKVGEVLGCDEYDYQSDQEVDGYVGESDWSLDSLTTGVGTDDEDTAENPSAGSVEMVDVETGRWEYDDIWVVPPTMIDDPADLIDNPSSTVYWRYKDGVAMRGDVTGEYIREKFGRVESADMWDYVRPHEAGTSDPDFSGSVVCDV
jgi:hypothetical protein